MAGLLFTDLEGSTAHVRALGDAYGAVLARHHELALRILRHDAPGAADRLLTLIQTPPARARDDLSALEAMELAREWLVVI